MEIHLQSTTAARQKDQVTNLAKRIDRIMAFTELDHLPIPYNLQATENMVRLHLKHANVGNSAGPGEIHRTVDELLADFLPGPICGLCNKNYWQGYLLNDRKMAVVGAIHKGSWWADVGNAEQRAYQAFSARC